MTILIGDGHRTRRASAGVGPVAWDRWSHDPTQVIKSRCREALRRRNSPRMEVSPLEIERDHPQWVSLIGRSRRLPRPDSWPRCRSRASWRRPSQPRPVPIATRPQPLRTVSRRGLEIVGRLAFLRISTAVLVHTNGWERSFQPSMKARSLALRSFVSTTVES